jgi:hypothetical protein
VSERCMRDAQQLDRAAGRIYVTFIGYGNGSPTVAGAPNGAGWTKYKAGQRGQIQKRRMKAQARCQPHAVRMVVLWNGMMVSL